MGGGASKPKPDLRQAVATAGSADKPVIKTAEKSSAEPSKNASKDGPEARVKTAEEEAAELASAVELVNSDANLDKLLDHAQDAASSWMPGGITALPEETTAYWAVALSEFLPEHEDELGLEGGEVIGILWPGGQGWMYAVKDSRFGFVPETWVKRVALQPAVVLSSFSHSDEQMLSVEKGELVGIIVVPPKEGEPWAYVIRGPAAFTEPPIGPGYVPMDVLQLARAGQASAAFAATKEYEMPLHIGQRVWMLPAAAGIEEAVGKGMCEVMTMEGARGFAPAASLAECDEQSFLEELNTEIDAMGADEGDGLAEPSGHKVGGAGGSAIDAAAAAAAAARLAEAEAAAEAARGEVAEVTAKLEAALVKVRTVEAEKTAELAAEAVKLAEAEAKVRTAQEAEGAAKEETVKADAAAKAAEEASSKATAALEADNVRLKNEVERLTSELAGSASELAAQKSQLSSSQESSSEQDAVLNELRAQISKLQDEVRSWPAKVQQAREDTARELEEKAATKQSALTSEISGLKAELKEAKDAATKAAVDVQRMVEEVKLAKMQKGAEDARAKAMEEKWIAEQRERRELHNKLMDAVGALRVACRVRPLTSAEKKAGNKYCVDVKRGELITARVEPRVTRQPGQLLGPGLHRPAGHRPAGHRPSRPARSP